MPKLYFVYIWIVSLNFDFLWLLGLNYWWVLVRELEVRYNYSGVKNFWCKIRKKNTRPLRFWQTDFQFQTGFWHTEASKYITLYCCVFHMETKRFSIDSLKYIISKIRVLTKIICATILRQINLKGRNLSHQIFSLTYLLACYLSIGLYNFCLRLKFCKVYLYYFVSLLTLFLCSLLSYLS